MPVGAVSVGSLRRTEVIGECPVPAGSGPSVLVALGTFLMVVLLMSTDQFAGAAAIERCGIGVVLDPNRLTAGSLLDAVAAVTTDASRQRMADLARSVAADGGADAAVRAILSS